MLSATGRPVLSATGRHVLSATGRHVLSATGRHVLSATGRQKLIVLDCCRTNFKSIENVFVLKLLSWTFEPPTRICRTSVNFSQHVSVHVGVEGCV